jgi:hypothetical protein
MIVWIGKGVHVETKICGLELTYWCSNTRLERRQVREYYFLLDLTLTKFFLVVFSILDNFIQIDMGCDT